MAQNDWENVKALGTVFSLGATMAAGVLLGYWIGSFIDRKVHTGPLFTVVMVLIGILASFKSVYEAIISNKGGD